MQKLSYKDPPQALKRPLKEQEYNSGSHFFTMACAAAEKPKAWVSSAKVHVKSTQQTFHLTSKRTEWMVRGIQRLDAGDRE